MALAPNVDLGYYAGETDGFSGADLQALLYNAHLEAIHDVINISSLEKEARQGAGVEGSTDEEDTRFTTFGVNSDRPALTQAERGQIAQRVGGIAYLGV